MSAGYSTRDRLRAARKSERRPSPSPGSADDTVTGSPRAAGSRPTGGAFSSARGERYHGDAPMQMLVYALLFALFWIVFLTVVFTTP